MSSSHAFSLAIYVHSLTTMQTYLDRLNQIKFNFNFLPSKNSKFSFKYMVIIIIIILIFPFDHIVSLF